MAAAGCSRGLEAIDAQILRALEDGSARIDGGSVVPERDYPDARELAQHVDRDRSPSTVNPPAEDLPYTPADEARDVTVRLAELSAVELGEGTEVRSIDLGDALRIVQRDGREYLSAEEDYIVAAIQLLVERHRWSPRLFNDTTVGVAGDDVSDSAMRVVNELRATKQLPYGGEVAASWIWSATEQLRDAATDEYTDASRLVLDASIPLLRGAGLVAQEELIQAERNLVYSARSFEDFRRRHLVEIAADYFDILQSQAQIENQLEQLKSLRFSQDSAQARYDAGRIRRFDLNTLSSEIKQAESSLASLRETYILQLQRFKVRLGIPVTEPLMLEPFAIDVGQPDISLDEASEMALTYRLDLQNQRDQREDARRAVANARNAVLPDLNVNASVGSSESDAPEITDYDASVTFGLPLDRKIERLQIRQAVIRAQQADRDYEQFRDQVVLDARQAVRSIELSRVRLGLAEDGVVINEQRVEELKLRAADVNSQQIVDGDIALLDARNERDRAITDLRNSVLQYLLQTGQLRVARDGGFQRLPGMPLTPLPTPEEPDPEEPAPEEPPSQ